MKFSCTQENISRGLAAVSRIASRNVNLPILHNVLLEAKEDSILLTSTNLELGVRVHIRGKVEKPGSFTVPAQVFSNYVSLITAERVDVELEGSEILVQAGNQNTKIKGEGASEFPLIPDVEKKNPLKLDAQDFKKAASQALIAVSHDDSRPELTGVLLEMKGKQLALVATDSYRLAERKMVLFADAGDERKVIIPADAMSELVRMIPEDEEELTLYFSDNQVLFETKEAELSSRLIEGTFPDYTQIIPQNQRTKTTIGREELIQAVKAASLFSRSGINDVNLHFSPDKQTATLTTVNNQVGENVTKVQAEVTGDSNNTIFNHHYLLDGLSHMSSDKVDVQLVDNASPGVFKPHGEEEKDFLYIIMPIKQ